MQRSLDRDARGERGGSGPWRAREWHESVTSTQDRARELAAEFGLPVVVLANRQRAGRGRRGRQWFDHQSNDVGKPTNLAVSVAVTPPADEQSTAQVPLRAGLAVLDVLDAIGCVGAQLKWPNDVLLPGSMTDGERPNIGKVAGILVERFADASPAAGTVLVVGVGVNLDWRQLARRPNDGFSVPASSLAEHLGVGIDREPFADALVASLAASLVEHPLGVDVAATNYRKRCATLGQQVNVELPDGSTLRGTASDVDEIGRLVVVTRDGQPHVITAGDVVHVRAAV